MHEIVTSIDRPPASVVSGLADVPTAVLSDVTTTDDSTLSHDVEPVAPGMSVAGPAITVTAPPGDNLVVHKAVTLASPGDVIVIDAGGYREAGIWGELLSLSCLHNGIDGTVIDGAARDVVELEELGYPVFARGISPKGSAKNRPGSINVPIACGGVSVEPGDVVVGDADGVAVVRADRAEAVLDAAREKLAAEDELAERLRDGEYIYDVNGYEERWGPLDVTER